MVGGPGPECYWTICRSWLSAGAGNQTMIPVEVRYLFLLEIKTMIRVEVRYLFQLEIKP